MDAGVKPVCTGHIFSKGRDSQTNRNSSCCLIVLSSKKACLLKTSFSTTFQIKTDPAHAAIVCKLHNFNSTVYAITVLVFLTNEQLSIGD